MLLKTPAEISANVFLGFGPNRLDPTTEAYVTDDRQDRIRRRAHAIWEQAGRPEGAHQEHWDQAAAEVDGAATKPKATPKKAAAKPAAKAKPAAAKPASKAAKPKAKG